MAERGSPVGFLTLVWTLSAFQSCRETLRASAVENLFVSDLLGLDVRHGRPIVCDAELVLNLLEILPLIHPGHVGAARLKE